MRDQQEMRVERFELRLTPSELESYTRESERVGMTLAEWLRMTVNVRINERCALCGSQRADRVHEELEPDPAILCWVGSQLDQLVVESCPRSVNEVAAIRRVAQWLTARGMAR